MKTKIFKSIPRLDAEIRTIEKVEDDVREPFFVEVGMYESLGEYAGDIITFTYEKEPLEIMIVEDIKEYLQEEYARLIDLGDYLSAREEKQLEALKKMEEEINGTKE